MNWNSGGYELGGNIGGLIGTLIGRAAIVAGNAETVFDEYGKARELLPDAAVFSANDVGVYLPVVDHMVSLHSDKLVHWSELRRCDPHATPWKTHSYPRDPHNPKWYTHSRCHENGQIDYYWLIDSQMGLSGYFAMQIAYIMGAGLIVLCGCPGDRTRRFFDGQVRQDYDYQSSGVVDQLNREMKRKPDFKAKVRSMGGFTKEFFGGLLDTGGPNNGRLYDSGSSAS